MDDGGSPSSGTSPAVYGVSRGVACENPNGDYGEKRIKINDIEICIEMAMSILSSSLLNALNGSDGVCTEKRGKRKGERTGGGGGAGTG